MSTKLTLIWLGVEVTVTGDYSPMKPGKFTGPPEACYPDEPAEFDIEDVQVAGESIVEMLMCLQLPSSPFRRTSRMALDDLAEDCITKLEEEAADDPDLPD